jgi:hypothetical protein
MASAEPLSQRGSVFENWLTLPRTWCARFVKNREEAALVVALARAGIVLDLLLHHQRQQTKGARTMQHVAGVLHRRIGANAGAGRGLSACLPIAAQVHQETQLGSAVLHSRLAESADVLRSLQQQLRQWVAMNTSIADELTAHKNMALQKRVLADAEAQLVEKIEALLRRLPQPVSDPSGLRHQPAVGAFGDQAWSSLGATCICRLNRSVVSSNELIHVHAGGACHVAIQRTKSERCWQQHSGR